MIRQVIYLPARDWTLIVFYLAGAMDADEILRVLRRKGCSDDSLARAEDNLRSGMQDTGLTYSNPSRRTTIMVIGEASSPSELWNTIDHEKGHASQHIASALGIDYRSEEQQYLTGEITSKMYPVARLLVCGS